MKLIHTCIHVHFFFTVFFFVSRTSFYNGVILLRKVFVWTLLAPPPPSPTPSKTEDKKKCSSFIQTLFPSMPMLVFMNFDQNSSVLGYLKIFYLKGSVHKHDNLFYQENTILLPLDARGYNLQYRKVLAVYFIP